MATASDSEPQIADTEAARLADRINVLLEKMGYPAGKGTEWWLHVTHEGLGGLTAMQAWQLGRQKQVVALWKRTSQASSLRRFQQNLRWFDVS